MRSSNAGGADAAMESTLRNLMMDSKRLDFDAPLISVRRFASPARQWPPTSASPSAAATTMASSRAEDGDRKVAGEGWLRRCSLPFYKSELKSGPVGSPGVVPFVWELSPGRPKVGPSTHDGSPEMSVRPPPVAPKPPPGAPLPISASTSSSPATSSPAAATVVAAASAPSASASLNGMALPKPMKRSSKDPKATSKLAAAEGPGLGEQRRGIIEEEYGNEEAFSDSLDVLSHTESCFVNCSTGGFSGGIDAREPSGVFSGDRQIREFMMGRFLPDAQAVAVGSPQNISRMPPASHSAPARRVPADGGRRRSPMPVPPPCQCYQHSVPLPYHYQRTLSSYAKMETLGYHYMDFGDDSGGYNHRDNDAGRRPEKGRGWLPRLCLRGSLCLLNPIPIMKVRDGHVINGSDRISDFAVSRKRTEGRAVVQDCRKSPIWQRRGFVVVDPDEEWRTSVGSSETVKDVVYTEEVSRRDHVIVSSKPSGMEGHGKNGSDGSEDLHPPAPPKSPSESWLCQALPSVQSKNTAPPKSFLGARLSFKRQVIRSSADPRWEAIAKTSTLPRMRFIDVLSRPANEE